MNNQFRHRGKLIVGPSRALSGFGHSGMDHTFRRVIAFSYLPNLKKDVIDYVRKCEVCQRNKVDFVT